MTNQEIRKLALENGFKLKQQPHGEMGLNPYVYDFARAVIDQSSQEILDEHPLPPLSDRERTELDDFIRQGLLNE